MTGPDELDVQLSMVSDGTRCVAVDLDAGLTRSRGSRRVLRPAPPKHTPIINLKAAKSLGITIPRAVLLRADEVIE